MIKFLVTGDNHFGRHYTSYEENVRHELLEARYESLNNVVRLASKENCDFIAVTGDLFESIGVNKEVIKRVAKIFGQSDKQVVIIPGNHDFYSVDERCWQEFDNCKSTNTVVLNEFRPYSIDCDNGTVVFYPAFCDKKHSAENNLGWIKTSDFNENTVNIGMAHGALNGLSQDEGRYFIMDENAELNQIKGIDAWFLGHTHISYPRNVPSNKAVEMGRVFNPGTHQQLDTHSNTDGAVFIVTVEKENSKSIVKVQRHTTGIIRFYNEILAIKKTGDTVLEDALKNLTATWDEKSVIKLKITGIVSQSEYEDRKKIYKRVLGDFLSCKINDAKLSEEITLTKIHTEFADTGFASKLLEKFLNEQDVLQQAYGMLTKLKN